MDKWSTVCTTCRRRGRKCDKTRPFCGTCAAKGLECEGYITRWTGVASRGKLSGKTIPVVDQHVEDNTIRSPIFAEGIETGILNDRAIETKNDAFLVFPLSRPGNKLAMATKSSVAPPPQPLHALCSMAQLEILYEILKLYKSQRDPNSPTASTLNHAANFEKCLYGIQLDSSWGMDWTHVTEVYRYTVILYLSRLFNWDYNFIIEMAFWSLTKAPLIWQLLWPFFHVALEITDKQRRQWIREQIDFIYKHESNKAWDAMAILERVWKDKDKGNNEEYINIVHAENDTSMIIPDKWEQMGASNGSGAERPMFFSLWELGGVVAVRKGTSHRMFE